MAKDAKYRYISSAPAPFIYVPMAQQPVSRRFEFYVRHAPGRQVGQEIRAAMAQVEPNVPVLMLQSFDDAAAIGLLPQKLAAWIAGSVGTIGIFLAALGLYGLMAFLVAQRTREIAIRMALGASDRDMRAMVLKQAGTLGRHRRRDRPGAGRRHRHARAEPAGRRAADRSDRRSAEPRLLFAIVLAIAAWTPARRAAATDPATALARGIGYVRAGTQGGLCPARQCYLFGYFKNSDHR